MKRRLSVLLATAMMLSVTVAASGPASALPQGNNGLHKGAYKGDYPHEDNGKHIGAGAGLGQVNNEGLYRRGLR